MQVYYVLIWVDMVENGPVDYRGSNGTRTTLESTNQPRKGAMKYKLLYPINH